eukprot:COSAG01_NODE_63029_length_281_cov_2.571429_2_plen_23_part_01
MKPCTMAYMTHIGMEMNWFAITA